MARNPSTNIFRFVALRPPQSENIRKQAIAPSDAIVGKVATLLQLPQDQSVDQKTVEKAAARYLHGDSYFGRTSEGKQLLAAGGALSHALTKIESDPKPSLSQLTELITKLEVDPKLLKTEEHSLWTSFVATCILPSQLPRDRVTWAQWLRVSSLLNGTDSDFAARAKLASCLPLAIPSTWIARRAMPLQADTQTTPELPKHSLPGSEEVGDDALLGLAKLIIGARAARKRLTVILDQRVARLGEAQQSSRGGHSKPWFRSSGGTLSWDAGTAQVSSLLLQSADLESEPELKNTMNKLGITHAGRELPTLLNVIDARLPELIAEFEAARRRLLPRRIGSTPTRVTRIIRPYAAKKKNK